MAKILIIKLGALGDVVMATSLIKQIQRHHPDDHLCLLTVKSFGGLFENWDGLCLHVFDRMNLKENLQTIAWIRGQKFRRVYDLQSNDRTGILCALSGIPERVGNHPRFPYNIHPKDGYDGQCHIYQRMLSVLESAGITSKPEIPHLPVSENEKKKIRDWIAGKGLVRNNFIIIHAGCSNKHPEKRWPYYGELARVLSKRGHSIIWVGAAEDGETNRTLSSITGIDATNKFSLAELAELGRHARFAITNDSGPMHVLSCSGVPIYAFFGPTDWRRNHAIGQRSNVISAGDEKYEEFRPASLDKINVDQVIDRLHTDKLI